MMRALGKLGLLTLLGIAIIVIPQFQSLDRMGGRRQAQSGETAPSEILVGVSWPFATLGDGFADGLRLGADQARAEWGIALRLDVRDDSDDWDIARRVALDFADTPDMRAVIGYHDPGVAIRASGVFQSARMPHLVAAALVSPPAHDLMIRLAPPIPALIDPLVAAVPSGPYAEIVADDATARTLADLFHLRHGGQRLLDLRYPRHAPDFTAAVIKTARLRPSFVLFSGRAAEASTFLSLLRKRGITVPVLLPMVQAGQMPDGDFAPVITADLYDSAATTATNTAFRQAFRARYGRDPDTWAALGHDAARLLAQGAAEAMGNRPRDLSQAIRAIADFQGAAGPYRFDRAGTLEGRTAPMGKK